MGQQDSMDHTNRDDAVATILQIPEVEDEKEEFYPEGGLRAWLVVLGAWLTLLASLSIMNTLATLQAYVSTHQLQNYSDGTIGWVWSVYTFVVFFFGVYIGPIFDKYGPKWLFVTGTLGLFTGLMLLSICQELWHFILAFGFLTGIATSLLFTPSFAVVGHYFMARRGRAIGIATTGGSIGGIIIPLMLDNLFPKIGWAWAIRCLAFFSLFCCTIASFLVRARLPPAENASTHPDLLMFFRPHNRAFAYTTIGMFLLEFAIFIPLTYITTYARHQGFSESMSYDILPILNAASFVGRALAGICADVVGPFNVNIAMTLLSALACLSIWLPQAILTPLSSSGTPTMGATAALVIFAVLTGIASGANISIIPVCVGRLCKTQYYGRYYATCYSVVSFACLVGVPVGGEILGRDGGSYWGMAVTTGSLYVAAAGFLYVARGWKAGWRWSVRF